ASHEINNPLANIAAQAQALLRLETDPERRRALAAIHTQAMRAHEMISDLMLFARPPQPEFVPIDVGKILQQAICELTDDARTRLVRLVLHTPDNTVICRGDATQLTVAFKALLQNALEAIGREGQIDITCHLRSSEDQEPGPPAFPCAEILIDDDGPGIQPEIRSRIFDPFFSGREAGRGLGFGLPKCWRIITAHEGTIRVESSPTHGARFTIHLPLGG
ncbi:MAG: HAMP domain-containing histidine kinase, partial [Pirellulales bacterium]|nr:HAMP domain-containing histidine kinase [Pirellulales bacterium]